VDWNSSEVDQTKGWSFNPTVEAKSYSTSATGGVVSARPGNITASGSFAVLITGSTVPAYPGEIADLKLYINATQYWQFANAMITDITEVVDIETNEIIALDLNWTFAGSSTGTGGTITKPDGNTYSGSNVGEIAEA